MALEPGGICTNVRSEVYDKFSSSASPGPARYETPSTLGEHAQGNLKHSASFRFGSSSRAGSFATKDTPGPSAYNSDKSTMVAQRHSSTLKSPASVKFTTATRDSMKGSDAPAPNAYNAPSDFDRTKSGRPKTADSRKRTSPAFSFSATGRYVRPESAGPGPGKYDTKTANVSTIKRSSTMRFSTASRYERPAGFGTPGPDYKSNTAMGKQVSSRHRSAPGFSFGSAGGGRSLGGGGAGPGPSKYSTASDLGRRDQIHKSAPGFKMSTSVRNPIRENGVPGPGRYGSADLRKKTPPAFTFGATKRDAAFKAKKTPGAGAYDISDSMGKQVESTRPSSATMRFTTSKRDGMYGASAGPGPGRYMTGEGIGGRQSLSTQKSAPSIGFGMSKGSSMVVNDTPGPNAYEAPAMMGRVAIARKPSSPGFKFTVADERSKIRGNNVPGPQYEVGSSLGKQVMSKKKSLGGVKFGTGRRFDGKPKTSTPGAGSYDVKGSSMGRQTLSRTKSSPGFSIGAR